MYLKMKKIAIVFTIFLLAQSAIGAEQLTLKTCQERAKINFPMIKQLALLEQTTRFNLENANNGYLPQLTLSAKATYQSQVTQLPFTLPNMTVPSLSKDQYQAVLEASQILWDGGLIAAQKKQTLSSFEMEKQKIEVDLFALNERVNQLFFGILLLSEQISQNLILQNELTTNYNRVAAYKKNGIANQSDLDAIKVEQLNSYQRETELKSTRKGYCAMLSVLTASSITEQTELTKPETGDLVLTEIKNKRPELGLFDAQFKMYDSQKQLIKSGDLPKLALFAQAGYGRPGLNMLTNEFSDFYIGGVRFSWNISGLYSQRNNLNKIEINKKTVELQKETFLLNNNIITKQQLSEIEKLQSILTKDDEIIRLRTNIKKAADVKLENGTITINDLIREINAENQAKQMKALHQIQLIMNVYQLKNNNNN